MKRSLLLLVIAGLFTGCKTADFSMAKLTDRWPWSDPDTKVHESQYEQPSRIVAIWSEAIYNQPGVKPVRGFGGRLYFYNAKNEAVPVEGQLVVYGYDDSDSSSNAQTNGIPDRKFVFTAEQLTKHFSPSELGASYSVWLPWDEVGGMKKTITLIPKFTAANGQLVMGQQTISVLSGKSPETQQKPPGGHFSQPEHSLGATSPDGSPVQLAGYQDRTGPANAKAVWQDVRRTNDAPRLKTSTIALPPSVQRRLELMPATTGPIGSSNTLPPNTTAPGVIPSAAPAGAAAAVEPAAVEAAQQATSREQPVRATAPPTRFSHPQRPAPVAASWPPVRGPQRSPLSR